MTGEPKLRCLWAGWAASQKLHPRLTGLDRPLTFYSDPAMGLVSYPLDEGG